MQVHSSTPTSLQVLVFKTNLRTQKQIRQVAALLDHEPGISRWNVDRWDIDRVLRIETNRLSVNDIIDLVTGAGHYCTVLPD